MYRIAILCRYCPFCKLI